MNLFALFIMLLIVGAGGKRACPAEGDMWTDLEEEPVFVRECPNGPLEETMDGCPSDLELADGHWTEWSEWVRSRLGSSQATYVTRGRTCTSPPPDKECGGMRCKGPATQVRTCSGPDARPVDGGWSEWSQWTRVASARKGGTGMSRMRTCTNPPPDCGGSDCEGTDYQIQPCVDCAPPESA